MWIVEWSYWVEFRFVGCHDKAICGFHKERWKLFFSISSVRHNRTKALFCLLCRWHTLSNQPRERERPARAVRHPRKHNNKPPRPTHGPVNKRVNLFISTAHCSWTSTARDGIREQQRVTTPSSGLTCYPLVSATRRLWLILGSTRTCSRRYTP